MKTSYETKYEKHFHTQRTHTPFITILSSPDLEPPLCRSRRSPLGQRSARSARVWRLEMQQIAEAKTVPCSWSRGRRFRRKVGR